MTKSKIEWTDQTWNPVVGCSRISEGCQNCYAERMAGRLANMNVPQYKQVVLFEDIANSRLSPEIKVTGWNGATAFVESALQKPLHWKKPRMIFVCSMGDLFHESVPFEWIDKVFAVMDLCPQHTFQVLTKRAARMREYFKSVKELPVGSPRDMAIFDGWRAVYGTKLNERLWPLPNVWLGVTAENQTRADERIPELLRCPAVVRFVSVEPMLGAVVMPEDGTACEFCGRNYESVTVDCGDWCEEFCAKCRDYDPDAVSTIITNHLGDGQSHINWVICGGESGPGARPLHPNWVRGLRDQCSEAGVPFLFKQWGGANKKKAGRLLDGVLHDEFPEVKV
ncbi:Bacteriophage protein gp37 [Anaerohalosphaera lusitana]|uniref:Bacteriophage protein gp37 n=1 Tax=Anaerohalosphaera lusitana TaxID=1936003 RepID=A0A1U9NR01_9BACT|nr:phage Gp37/Gp68 family protein [Anaerohalosphaera lusitana]AQT69946.1 Bacteriophage protein gp37 [Anaerohalosphaera lusitana]